MTTTRVYKSTDAGAPVLSGAASKMIDLLDAVLVNGYNSKTITITRTGDTATATCTAHGFVAGRRVLISGATPSDYNGEFTVLTAATDTFTFEVLGSPTTPPTGTITCIVAPAGWTKPFTGTNKAAFRNSVAAGGTGMYLRVLDDASLTGAERNAAVRAYLTMSDVDTGTIPTPTVAQLATGIVWRKSNTVDSTARPWILIADELTFYLCVDTGTFASEGGAGTYAAGDFASLVPADAYRFFVAGRESAGAAGTQGAFCGLMTRTIHGFTQDTNNAGTWIGRGYTGIGSPERASIPTLAASTNNHVIGGSTASALANSAPGTGLQMWTPAYLVAAGTIHGKFRGLYAPINTFAGVAMGTDVVNPPGLTGTLTTLRHGTFSTATNTTFDGHMHVDITNAWPT